MLQTPSISFAYDRKDLSDENLRSIYLELLYPRLIEEKMLILLRQGKISKWFSGIGQEAISVGSVLALHKDEWIFTMHRNLGVFTGKKIPLSRLFSQWQGKESGFTNGRDRSFHFGAPEFGIVGMISHLGPQLSLADGVALAHQLKQEQKVTLAFTGDGGTSEGEFHEALNVAAVWQLPVIFVIENNGYGLSTPTNHQYKCKNLVDRAAGYGMRGARIQGNDILAVYHTIKTLAEEMRLKPEPILIECETFRMRGHEEASGTKYVPKEHFEEWDPKDPILNFERFLISEGVMSEQGIETVRKEMKKEIHEEILTVMDEEEVVSSKQKELQDVYCPHEFIARTPASSGKEMRFVDAVAEALDLAMEYNDNLVVMGQDIAEYGGVFKVTEGLLEKYGPGRVRNTPLCESAIIGASMGLSLKGYKSMVEMQFADFVTCGFNQIVNNLAKLHYRWGYSADVVVRMPTGAGLGAGPFHSQSNEAWFTHVPGLKVVYPSNPYDAKGLLLSAFEDPNPIMFFEHKGLYRKISGTVPEGYYNIPIGKGKVVKQGDQLSIITYGMGVHWALDTVEKMGVSAEIVDLRTLYPLDFDTIAESVKKTNRVVVLHEDTGFGGIGGEIAAWITEHMFAFLDAPVMRCVSLDTPIPFAPNLEKRFLANYRLEETLERLINY